MVAGFSCVFTSFRKCTKNLGKFGSRLLYLFNGEIEVIKSFELVRGSFIAFFFFV